MDNSCCTVDTVIVKEIESTKSRSYHNKKTEKEIFENLFIYT